MSKHFAERQIVKELAKEAFKEKDHKEKESSKDQKDKEQVKEIKDKEKEKEKEHKDKEHKEFQKDYKEKDHKELDKEVEYQPFQQSVPDPASARSAAPALKFEPDKYFYEKYYFEKHLEKFYEKAFKDKDKDIYEFSAPQQNVGDPALMQRVAALEAVVGKLMHFIPAEMRPDLSTGALSQEPDAKKEEPAPPHDTPSEKGKK